MRAFATKAAWAPGEATFSPCGRYRYTLERYLGGGLRALTFIMLNPSTADGALDDPTVAKCVRYASAWGFDIMRVRNVFAWRSTDPQGLWRVPDPVGPDNDQAIRDAVSTSELVVAAWGQHGGRRGQAVAEMVVGMGRSLDALALTAKGEPRHPLYLRDALTPSTWKVPR